MKKTLPPWPPYKPLPFCHTHDCHSSMQTTVELLTLMPIPRTGARRDGAAATAARAAAARATAPSAAAEADSRGKAFAP